MMMKGTRMPVMKDTGTRMITDIVIRDLTFPSVSVGARGFHSAGGVGITGTIIIPTTIGTQHPIITATADGVADIIIIGILAVITITGAVTIITTLIMAPAITTIMVTHIMEVILVVAVMMIGATTMIGVTTTIIPAAIMGQE